MKEYLLRIDGEMADIEPLSGESCQDRCYEVEELEAVMVAMIKTLREEIQGLKGRITELEGRPYITITGSSTFPYTYNPNPEVDPNTTNCPHPWWTTHQVICKH